ncbi:MAG: RbcX chaperonin protein [Leptolyngbya sp. DLM2.Bin15]|uniref:RuBisCO chaperone RbcX n=1 Tax=Leptolyngbya sp. CCY15150 TaxID=2767772 RepID=UPI0013844739|nr:chaperonin family protein RbcX [Leptolyngbya sp. CCY15150]TVQ23920.1 MAG: RbcX chaperonin protein [Leptolyngbya sp. DLM2.Bin15]
MDLKRIAKDTVKVLVSYLTYQAVRVVVSQLGETNPPLSLWLNNFSTTGKIQDGEVYLSDLMQANQDLAFRVMTVRAHLAEEVADYLPEMVRTGIQQANMEHRRQYLERMTQLSAAAVPDLEATPDVMEEGDRPSD